MIKGLIVSHILSRALIYHSVGLLVVSVSRTEEKYFTFTLLQIQLPGFSMRTALSVAYVRLKTFRIHNLTRKRKLGEQEIFKYYYESTWKWP